jgi:hypothetical protein
MLAVQPAPAAAFRVFDRQLAARAMKLAVQAPLAVAVGDDRLKDTDLPHQPSVARPGIMPLGIIPRYNRRTR